MFYVPCILRYLNLFYVMCACDCRGRVGDLFIVLHVDKKHGIQRDGLNLYSKINVYYTDAILGTTIKVLFLTLFNFLVVS